MATIHDSSWSAGQGSFPPYHLLDAGLDEESLGELDARARRTVDKTRKLTRLYHQTQELAWNPNEVLDELVSKHGGIHVPKEKREALGRLFAVLLWGELAAWNVAADLARSLPDVDGKMAATGQAFDEARHFTVLRDYLARAEIELPPLNPFGRRLLVRILDTPSPLEKLYGMQLMVETLALGIFKGLAISNIEPVLTDLLTYVERDEARHVGLGVLYLPRMLERATFYERAHNWAFNLEMFLYTAAGGQWLDADLIALGVDHRALGHRIQKIHEQLIHQMRDEHGVGSQGRVKGVYTLSRRQHLALIDFLHPDQPDARLPLGARAGRAVLRHAIKIAARALS